VQRAFDEWEAAGKRRNNPEAVARIADLLGAFRDRGAPVFHIRHQGTRPNSSFLPGASGYPVKDEAREIEASPSSSSGKQRLHRHRSGGAVARGRYHDARHLRRHDKSLRRDNDPDGRHLGFDARLVRGRDLTFDRTGPDGDAHSAEDIHAMTLANLNGEFARIVLTAEAIAGLDDSGG